MEYLYNSIKKKMLTGQGRRIWVLNRKYCSDWTMTHNEARVVYSYLQTEGSTPFSVDAIKDIEKCSYMVFRKSYMDERNEMLDHDAQDLRIQAIWSFYKNVHQNDIILYVHGSFVDGYYIVTSDHVVSVSSDDSCEHTWLAEVHKFKAPIEIKDRFGSPFFKTLDGKLGNQIVSEIKSRIGL